MQTRLERIQQQRAARKAKFFRSRGFIWSVIMLGVLLLGLVSYYGFSIFHFLQSIQTPKEQTQSAAAWTGTDRVNILLMGVDNRNNDPHPRSDSMVVVSIDPVTKTARMFSIMRDTWYKIPGYGFEKINAAYALGGPDLAIKTVSTYLQIPIHYYVKTDFQGFEKIVDAVGGVTIDVEKDMDYIDDGVYDIHLKKGVQLLDGKHALMYVRFRHDAMSDFARTDRQRKFLVALAEKLKTPGSLVKLPSVLDAIRPYVDTNMQLDDMLKLGKLMAEVDVNGMKPMQIPPENDFVISSVNGMSVLIPDVYKCRMAVHDALGMTDVVIKTTDDQYPLDQASAEPAALQQQAKDDPAPQPSTNVPSSKQPSAESSGTGTPASQAANSSSSESPASESTAGGQQEGTTSGSTKTGGSHSSGEAGQGSQKSDNPHKSSSAGSTTLPVKENQGAPSTP